MDGRPQATSTGGTVRGTRRGMVAIIGALLLVGILPGAVSADRVTRFHDHTVNAYCEGPIDGGNAYAFAGTSLEYGDGANIDVFLDPAIPYEEPATYSGATGTVTVVEGGSLLVSADMPVTAADGSDLGPGTLAFDLAADGPPEAFTEAGFGNHKSMTEGTRQTFSGTASFTFDTVSVAMPACFGEIVDVSVRLNNPQSFVGTSQGLDMSCFWEEDDTFAAINASKDAGGTFADAFISTPDGELFGFGEWAGTLGLDGVDVTVTLTDGADGTGLATGQAAFTPIGTPVTSLLRDPDSRRKVTEQPFDVDGIATFSTGHSFPMDAEHCRVVEFSSHIMVRVASGPKPGGRSPVNDLPSGAIALQVGDKLNTTNRAAAVDAEVPITTCPEGEFDDFGRTLWYTIKGTGQPVTIDTAGSQVDTLIGVYTTDGVGYLEVACIDDVFFDPIGSTYQAALTVETESGVTYHVQIGGYRESVFVEIPPQYGQIRIAVH
jgi:hypothetical protein